jgi:1-deoxy-D-xylulose-5-phosphate synthase
MIESRQVEPGILETINSPEDLKRLPESRLPELAEEIRRFLLQSVTKTGGHLASNLGTVELTLALHYVFDSPRDRLVWDTGHQAYAHKLLTGRREGFSRLRQLDGLSGFPSPKESAHDAFGTGHASTSIAAALGLNNADDSHWTIAVIGDGALTGGLALTGLNNSSLARKRFIVVLNDNGMSIDANVGTIARHLSNIKARPSPRWLNRALRGAISRVFGGESWFRRIYEKVKDSIFYFFIPRRSRGVLFEEMGLSYFGPYDGHNVISLVRLFKSLKRIDDEPLLVHMITQKGHGYAPAEDSPTQWHGISAGTPLRVEDDSIVVPADNERRSVKSYTEVFADTMIELAGKYPDIVAITAAMPSGTGLKKFGEVYPDRFYDVGISEEFAVTFACGLAHGGKRPVCAIYSTFMQRAFDQLLHDAALQELPVVFALDRGGIVGADGETHQGVFDLSYLRMIPNFTVMVPKDEEELRRMLLTALEHRSGPCAIRYPRESGLGVPMPKEIRPLEIGTWELLREGEQVAVLALGTMVPVALEAAKLLEKSGLNPAVVNARFVRPMDAGMLLSLAKRCRLLVTVEENVACGGFGSGVVEYLSQKMGDAMPRVRIIGLPDKFVEHGGNRELRERYGLSAIGVTAAVLCEQESAEQRLKIV